MTHHPHNLDSISPRRIVLQTLPLRHPALRRVRDRDEAFVDLARGFLDPVEVAAEFEEGFAVWAAFAVEFGLGQDYGAAVERSQRCDLEG